MKTDAIVEVGNFKNGYLMLKVVGNIDIQQIKYYLQNRNNKYPIQLSLSDKYKKRGTGKNSQNTKLHGIIRIIANSTGNSFEIIKYEIKRKAMNELNYPIMKDDNGEVVWNKMYNEPFPQSEANCTTVEASILIESAYLLASDLGIFI